MSCTRRLLLLTADQLDLDYPAFAQIHPERDLVVQIETDDDFTHVPSHKQRIALFLSAMRHFATGLSKAGYRTRYVELNDPDHTGSLASELERLVADQGRPETLVLIRPGDWRTLHAATEAAEELSLELELLEDPHFLLTPEEFGGWAEGRKSLVLEHFYRWIRKRRGILLTDAGEPLGDAWNFDKENRKAFDAALELPERPEFEPDARTREILELVEQRYPDAPGSLTSFVWPVTHEQARQVLGRFIDECLPYFGDYQDAMVKGRPWMFHSLLSPMLNLKLLDPRDCVTAAVEALETGEAPINAVEGFVRQIVGWREFIRGIYWHEGPDYGRRNHLEAEGRLPDFYWNGETDMVCVEDAVASVLEHGYGHHIQRLMVTGNLALTAGVEPAAVSDWYLGMYVDSMDWVTLPNTAGMVMFADGGVVGSKPYASTGKYIQRMSDYCGGCRFDPAVRVGRQACPFTTFYWDFLIRHRDKLEPIPRMRVMYRNVDRLDDVETRAIAHHANELRAAFGVS